jgi:hypothetical protein
MRLTAFDRLRAWLLTGPLGHLVAGVADWIELLVRWQFSRLRARVTRARGQRA